MSNISEAVLMDNIKYMRQFPDKFFDIALVDPQYGINATKMQMGSAPNRKEKGNYPSTSTAVRLKKGRLNHGSGKLKNRVLNQSDIDWDDAPPPPRYFKELFRVSKNQIIWGGNYFKLPPTRCIGCWDKRQPWENFSQWEFIWTSYDGPAWMVRYSNTGGKNEVKKIHPTQKPLPVYHFILNKFAIPGDKILDTHMGSQASRIACFDLELDYWGCDKSKLYFLEGNRWFENHTKQQRLFSFNDKNITDKIALL